MNENFERIGKDVLVRAEETKRYEIYASEEDYRRLKPWVSTDDENVFLNFRKALLERQPNENECQRSVPAYATMLLKSYRALMRQMWDDRDAHPFAFARTLRNHYSGAIDVLEVAAVYSMEKRTTHLAKLQSQREHALTQQKKLQQPAYAQKHHRVPDVLEQIHGALFAIELLEKGWDDFYNYLPKTERDASDVKLATLVAKKEKES